MSMDRDARRAITALRGSAALRRYVEAMVPARIMLWIMYTVEHDGSGVATDELRAACAASRAALGDLITATGNSMLGVRRMGEALFVLHHVVDAQFGPYAEGRQQKSTAWMAIAAHHLAATLLDEGLIPPMEIGSVMAGCMDRALEFVTAEDVDLYQRYAHKAAAGALAALRDRRTYGLYLAPFDPASHRAAGVVAAINAPGARVVA